MPRAPKRRGRPTANAKRQERRGTATQRGYGWRWAKVRAAFMARPENVLCRHCEAKGRTVVATDLDHITPHKGDARLFWSEANWQPLCKSCHSRKTAAEDGGFGNATA